MKKKFGKKTMVILIVLIVLVLLSIEMYRNGKTSEITNFQECVAAGNPVMESYPRQCRDPVSGQTFTEEITPIGGERDEHGCLIAAGFSWNETYNVCVRNWELNQTDIKILNIIKDYLGENRYGLTYLYSVPEDDAGSFTVFLETEGRPRTVDITSWDLINVSLTPEECLAKGGQPLNIVSGDTCESNETNIGKVTGFVSPNICCVPNNIHICKPSQRNASACITLWKPVCGYPLEETFSNSCFACSSERIEYYIEGECPEAS